MSKLLGVIYIGSCGLLNLPAHTLIVRTIINSLCCYCPAQHLISKTQSSPQSDTILINWVDFPYLFLGKVWFLSWFWIAFVLKVWLWCSFSFLFLWVQDILWRTQFSKAVQGLISGWTEKRWHDANIAKHDSCRCPATICAKVGISGVWWCSGDSKTHRFIEYAHPDCLWPLQKQM